MEKKQLNVSLEDRLLQARSEGLENRKESMLRPHGKLWGMDVFSWYQPNVHILANTLHSFPFPVVWVGNANDIRQTLEEDPTVCVQINTLLTFDNPVFMLATDEMSKIKNVLGVNSLEDGLKMIKAFKRKNSVLLFSASGENWKESKQAFENFLSLFQTV